MSQCAVECLQLIFKYFLHENNIALHCIVVNVSFQICQKMKVFGWMTLKGRGA
jgi:hypothetical protein